MNLMTCRPENFFSVADEIRDFLNDREASASHVAQGWPRVNIFERENEYVLEAEVPGMKPEEIHIEALNDHLVLRGSVGAENNDASAQYRVREFSRAGFERGFRIGDAVDQEKISARIADGILTVRLLKKEKAQPRKIRIELSPE